MTSKGKRQSNALARLALASFCVLLWATAVVACGGEPPNNNQNTNSNRQNNNVENQNNSTGNQNNANQNNANQNNANQNNANQNNANQNNSTPPPTIPGELKPKSWGSLKLGSRKYPLPKDLAGSSSLAMVIQGKDLWVGGKGGLFRWSNGKFLKVDSKPVIGLVVWSFDSKNKALLIGREEGVDVWLNQTIQPSSLNNALEPKDKIRALVARGDKDIWVGTDKTLWRWQNNTTPMQKFDAIKGVKSIFADESSKELVVHTADNKIFVLREEKGSWLSRSLEAEVEDTKMEDIMPWQNGEFWGLSKGKLFFRKKTDTKAAWWPFRLKPDKDKEFEWSVKKMALDSKANVIWLWAGESILRIDEEEARKLNWKEALKNVVLFKVGVDGALWVSDGTILWRVGQEGAATTYEKDVKPFVSQSCLKCHKPGGSADFKPLLTYENVRAAVNDMIRRIEDKSSPMPPPPSQLVGGDAETLRRWIQGGYRR